MSKIAAVYCVYEDSGFLHESVRRIYDLMDKIVFLVNFKPWNGNGNKKFIEDTFSTILNIYDPDKKLEIISSYWESEAEQRNFGLDHLNKNNIDWCFIIDDDEMYNFEELKKAIHEKIFKSKDFVFLSPHQVYWKARNFCIDKIALALPSFCRTDRKLLYFNDARAIIVNGGTWYTFQPYELVCHHFSYIRNDDQMQRKIQNFSHADPSLKDWYKNVWLKWQINSENLHPNQDNRASFKKAISVIDSPYQLENIFIDKKFENYLQSFKINSYPHLNWLKNDSNKNIINFIYNFVLNDINKNFKYNVYTDTSNLEFFAICEAILKSGYEKNCSAFHLDATVNAHSTYKFCSKGNPNQVFDFVIWNGLTELPKTKYLLTAQEVDSKHTFEFNNGLYFKEL